MKLVILFLVTLLAGCEKYSSSYTDSTDNFSVKPPELKDCKIFRLISKDNEYVMTVVRCPNSTTSTTTQVGKAIATTVVIDGVEYQKKE